MYGSDPAGRALDGSGIVHASVRQRDAKRTEDHSRSLFSSGARETWNGARRAPSCAEVAKVNLGGSRPAATPDATVQAGLKNSDQCPGIDAVAAFEAVLIGIAWSANAAFLMFDAEGDLLGAEFRAENSAGEELALTAFVVPPFLTAHPAFSTHPPATCLASGATTVSSRCRVGMGNVRSSSPNPARSR